MSVSPQIDALAAEVRRRSVRQSPAAKKQTRKTADTFAADLPGIPPEHVGAVLLRAAVLATHLFQADPGASARDAANLLGAAGQRLYHQGAERHPSGIEIVADERIPEDVAGIVSGGSAEVLKLPEREPAHERFAEPGWEYATTEGPRKQWDAAEVPPQGDGWERNTDAGRGGWDRFDYTERSYWRRRIPQYERLVHDGPELAAETGDPSA